LGPEQVTVPVIDLSFPHQWRAEILAARPLILPSRHFTYPREVEEIERGALEVLVQREGETGEQPFLATCTLGFRDPSLPSGIWSAPNPHEACAVAGGYAYLIDTRAAERFTMLPYRPVFAVLPVVERSLLLFVGSRSILAWGATGQAWESTRLSDEGIAGLAIDGGTLHGLGWSMMSDKETPFALDLATGHTR